MGALMTFALDLVGTYQDSDGGEGRQCPSPLFFKGNLSCTGLPFGGVATRIELLGPIDPPDWDSEKGDSNHDRTPISS